MSSTTKFYGYTTSPENQRPVAELAFTEIEGLLGSIIQLDGRNSRDPEAQPLTFSWSFTQVPIGSALTSDSFKDLRPESTAVSFIPDVLGVYVVQLVVNDGDLDSEPATTTVRVKRSRVPCGEGIVPEADFLWSHVSNFWNLVEDKDKFTAAWSATMQLIGAELIKLWNADYNKSLATIQEVVRYKWQQYSPVLDISDETQRVIAGSPATGNDNGTNGVSGAIGSTPGLGNTSVFRVPYGDISDPDATDFTAMDVNYGARGRILVVNGEGYTIQRVYTEEDNGTDYSVALVDQEEIPDGLVGATWRIPHLIFTPQINLEEEGVRKGDVVVFEARRRDVGLTTELRAQVVGVDRNKLGFEFTTQDLSEGAVDSQLFRELVRDLKIVPVDASDTDAAAAAEALISFIPTGINLSQRPFSPFRITLKVKEIIRNTSIPLPDDVVGVPALQHKLYEPETIYRENLDYVVEGGYVDFLSTLFSPAFPAPDDLWAECVFVDNAQTIENNFGRLVEIAKDDLTVTRTRAPYLSAVKGLFYAYVNGPTVDNIRLGLQILLGLPFAEERSIILEIEEDYSIDSRGLSLGRMLVDTLDSDGRRTGQRRTYFYPTVLGLEENPNTGETYKIGGILDQWAPISKGVEVQDYIKDPNWWINALQGLEVLKFFTFKAVIDGDVFDDNDVAFAFDFLKKIKPAYTKIIVNALRALEEDIELEEDFTFDINLKLFEGNTWGLETGLRLNDDNQQGFNLWKVGSRPFSTRITKILTDVETSKDGTDVLVTSQDGWTTSDIRAREAADSPYTGAPLVEGDIFVIFPGQSGATLLNAGLYEIKEVVDGNNLKLLAEASRPDPLNSYVAALDADMFDYGANLRCTIVRRDSNPMIKGDDLVTNAVDSDVTSSGALFISNGIGVDDHLIIESGANAGEYRIDAINASAPYISETSVALKDLNGDTPSFSALTGQDFRVIRHYMIDNHIVNAQSVYTTQLELHVLDPYSGDQLDAFTPGMVGTKVNVSNSDDSGNDGEFTITGYIGPGKVVTDSASTTSDTAAQADVRLNSIWHRGFEAVEEMAPADVFQADLVLI